jgi:hypothetical protein
VVADRAITRASGRGTSSPGVLVLDVIYLAATLALFALVGVIAKAVEKLGPRPGGSAQRPALRGEEQG